MKRKIGKRVWRLSDKRYEEYLLKAISDFERAYGKGSWEKLTEFEKQEQMEQTILGERQHMAHIYPEYLTKNGETEEREK